MSEEEKGGKRVERAKRPDLESWGKGFKG